MDDVKKYIEKRYDRWLDYSVYHCQRAGIDGEGVDVLNEVLCDLLQKPTEMLLELLNKKSGQYRELDYFVLRMIKLNATSPTSPYRHRYRSVAVDANVDYMRLEIEDMDVDEDEYDSASYILEKTRKVREILDALDLTPRARKIFEHRFLHGEPFTEWDGPEPVKMLYETYTKVTELIKNMVNGTTML